MMLNSELPFHLATKPVGSQDFNLVYNDYDFVLFHLLEKSGEYYKYYKDLRQDYPQRLMILDNSAYEFFVQNKKLDLRRYMDEIEDLEPDYYILPDVLMDVAATVNGVNKFVDLAQTQHRRFKSRPLAVLQGDSVEDFRNCLKEYDKLGLKDLCIPFHNSFLKEWPSWKKRNSNRLNALKCVIQTVYHFDNQLFNEDQMYALGRAALVDILWDDLKDRYVHLLGSHCPFEVQVHPEFNTMDTGYPVKLGLEGVLLGYENHKPTSIIDDFFDDELEPEIEELIALNLRIFHNCR